MQSGFNTKWILLRKQSSGLGTLALFGWYAISLTYSMDLAYGVSRLETKASLLAFPVILLSTAWSRKSILFILRSFVYAMLVIAGALVVAASYRYYQTGQTQWFFYHELTEPIDLHAIYFANYLVLGLLFVIIIPDLIRKRFWIAALLVVLIFMLTALSLIGFLFLLGLVGGYIELSKRIRPILVIPILSGMVLLVLVLALTIPGTRKKILQIDKLKYTMSDPDYAWNSITFRLALWECAMPVIAANPLAGVGIGDENNELQKSFVIHDFREGIRCNYDVHNQYLSTWMSTGVIGLLILLFVLLYPCLKAIGCGDRLMLAFMVMMAISFATESFLSSQKGIVFFAFFYTLLMVRMKSEFLKEEEDYVVNIAQ